MGVGHSMQKDQVDEVLTEFENTTRAIKNIDGKVCRVKEYVKEVDDSRHQFVSQAEEAKLLFDRITDSMLEKSDTFLDFFTDTLDRTADLVELLEVCLTDLHVMDVAGELQKELAPLLVPVVVLVCIVTVSNVLFGFLLASDLVLSESLSFEAVFGGSLHGEETGVNILNIFSIFHVVLLSMAIVYLILELCRRQHWCKSKASSEPMGEEVHTNKDEDDSAGMLGDRLAVDMADQSLARQLNSHPTPLSNFSGKTLLDSPSGRSPKSRPNVSSCAFPSNQEDQDKGPHGNIMLTADTQLSRVL